MKSMRSIALVASLAIIASVAISAPANAAEAKWDCSTRSGATSCMWRDCGVSTSEPGKLSLWASGSGDMKGTFHLILLSGGNISNQQWTNTSGGDKPVPEDAKIDIFERECVQNGALKNLAPEIQEQFRGKYGVPERPPAPEAPPEEAQASSDP